VAEAVELVIAQRLVRRLCRTCRSEARPSDVYATRHRVSAARLHSLAASTGPGCPDCNHTGYSGRVAIYEFLRSSKALRKAITENRTADELRAAAHAEGVVSLREAGLRLVERGVTSLAEVLSQTPDPD
jgi:type II secretory ATPase GspE/PulE/Tfp pilus assembly ATPase PilB-like protein